MSSMSKKRKIGEYDDADHPSTDVEKAYDIILKGKTFSSTSVILFLLGVFYHE